MKSVTYYTHEASDTVHSTNDSLALVIKDNGDNGLDLVVFPVGGPVQFVRAYEWDEDAPLPPPGGSYWRDEDSDPPDFGKAYRHYNDPAFQDMLRRQAQELDRTPIKDHPGLLEAHRDEQESMMSDLDGQKDGSEKKPKEPPPESDADRMAAEQRQREARESNQVPGSAPTDMGRRV